MYVRPLQLAIVLASTIAPLEVFGEELPEVAVYTAGMQRHGGFFPVYWDAANGKVLLEIESFGAEFLFLTALETGLGSNPVGLDRGQLGESAVCRWRRVGRRVFLEQQNLAFRAEGAPAAERLAVRDSFAPSILWAGEVVAEEDSRSLVDVTSLVVSDRHGIGDSLASSGQGNYSLDQDRSFPADDLLAAFPDNTELPAWLTFAGSGGGEVRAVAANPKAFTIRQRISLIRLPDPDYQRRPFDPRIGSFRISYADYAVPLEELIFKSFMVRHRLQLDDAGNVVEPIVYYVDAAAPEPVRSALVEGASWWAEAFEAAGFPGGFRVEVAPAGMDPLDIRFHFIQWVHRQTRGWSYGSTVTDPRSGEIIKGHVSLGSLRVRQNRLLTENVVASLAGAPAAACGMQFPASQTAVDYAAGREAAIEISLARIRQLAAHEVGHTLGIAHNFAASTYGDRASVMDYPAPRFRVNADGEIDATYAYAVGMGVWDKRTIDYMYRPERDVEAWRAYVDEKLAEDIHNGVRYLSDADARPLGGAHPSAHLWDNGADPIAELESVLEVRRIAMQRFGPDVLLPGEPQGELVRAFAPLYFYHRYQSEAVAKLIGGVDYSYSMPGDEDAFAKPVDASRQGQAVEALLDTLRPNVLAIDGRIIELLTPAVAENAWSSEAPRGYTDPVFDPLAAAETAAAMTIQAMLHPARAARLMGQAASSEASIGLIVVLDPLSALVEEPLQGTSDAGADAVARRVATTAVNEMIALASNVDAREDVRAAVRHALVRLAGRLSEQLEDTPSDHRAAETLWTVDKIERFLQRPDVDVRATPNIAPPPGSPIGSR